MDTSIISYMLIKIYLNFPLADPRDRSHANDLSCGKLLNITSISHEENFFLNQIETDTRFPIGILEQIPKAWSIYYEDRTWILEL